MSLRRSAATAVLAAALSAALPLAARAQASPGMPESYRQVQLAALRTQRQALLAMADSMPESLYRDKATPIQRSFAQQLHHAASSFAFFVPRFMNAPAPTGLPDTAAVFGTRAGLRAYINGVYDYAEVVLRTQSAADREATVSFFGMQRPRWEIWDELNQHTFWTAGQVVANFRNHNMAPPGFGFF